MCTGHPDELSWAVRESIEDDKGTVPACHHEIVQRILLVQCCTQQGAIFAHFGFDERHIPG